MGICADLAASMVGFPNMYGMGTQYKAAQSVPKFEALAAKVSYPYVMLFACAALFPACENNRLINPCRSFCEGGLLSLCCRLLMVEQYRHRDTSNIVSSLCFSDDKGNTALNVMPTSNHAARVLVSYPL